MLISKSNLKLVKPLMSRDSMKKYCLKGNLNAVKLHDMKEDGYFLYVAVFSKNTELVKYLVEEKGYSVGTNPILAALDTKNHEALDILLEKGRVSQTTIDGLKPKLVVDGETEMLRVLEKHGY